MAVQDAIINYSGRQIDVELLQSITEPLVTQQVSISNVTKQPKIVTGVQKALQRYTTLFLSILGDVRFAADQGTNFMAALWSGRIWNAAVLLTAFALANQATLRQMYLDDARPEVFGDTSADEVIAAAVLEDYSVDATTGTVSLTIAFTTAAGSVINYVIPVATAR